jgi:hypothetical protein
VGFTTVDAVKTLLGIPGSDTSQDARLGLIVDAVNAEILGWFNLTTTAETSYSGTYDVDDSDLDSFWLRQYPVIGVDSISVDGEAEDVSDYYLVNPARFGRLRVASQASRFYRASGSLAYGRKVYSVTHRAGWAGGVVPDDLAGAAALLAISRAQTDAKLGFSSEKIGQYQYQLGGGGAGAGGISGAIGADGIPISARRIFSQHLRIFPPSN